MTSYSPTSQSNTKAPLDDAKKDFENIKDDAASLAGHLKDDAVKLARTATGEAKEKIEDLASLGGDFTAMLDREIKTHPRQTIAVAFAAGIILSLLLRK